MNRNALAAFRAVALAGSVSRGAEDLGVSQPAVSAQISSLEKTLKTTLFERLPRGVRLTQAGTALLEFAQQIASLESGAQRAMEELNGVRRGQLKIGASRTIGAYCLPQLLVKFYRDFPGIELSAAIENTNEIHQQVLQRTVEIALTEGVVEHPELTARIFARDDLIAVAPPGHALLKKPTTVAVLCKEPLIYREVGSGTRVVLERALATRRLTPRPLISLGSPEAIKRLVAAGLGLAFMSRLAVADELAVGRLIQIQLTDLKIPRPLYLVRLKSAELSPAAAAFASMLKE